MKKFKFTLQSVHNVRELREENEQLELSRLQAEAEKAAERIRQIEDLKREALEKYTARLHSDEPINVFELEMNSNHLSNLDRLRREAVEILEQKEKACARQRDSVAAATRSVKVTSRLRDTQEQRHRSDVEKKEQTAADELVSATYARRMTQ